MAGQDIQKRLQPGQSQPVQVGGDFIFLKFADRPIVVIINGGESSGSRVIMEAGDKYRPGAFQSFEIENTDKERAAQITMTVGRGDYQRQIVKGELSVVTQLRKEDGELVDDTRSWSEVSFNYPQKGFVKEAQAGQQVKSISYDETITRRWNQGQGQTIVNKTLSNEIYRVGKTGYRERLSTGAGNLDINGELFYFHSLFWCDSPVRYGYHAIIHGQSSKRQKLAKVSFTTSDEEPVLTEVGDITTANGVLTASNAQISVTELENGDIVFINRESSPRMIRVNDALEVQAEIPFLETGSVASVEGRLYSIYSGGVGVLQSRDPKSLELIKEDPLSVDAGGYGYLSGSIGGLLAVTKGTYTTDSYVCVEPVTEIVAQYATAETTVGCWVGFQKPEIDPFQRVYIEPEKLDNGRYRGPLIKMILVSLFGSVPDNYLDSVYAIHIENGQSIGTGNSSFARVGIKDLFEFSNGATVKIQHDAQIIKV